MPLLLDSSGSISAARVKFMTEGPAVVMVLEAAEAIKK